jgi:dTDP-4-dehydrorhamnose reductase
MPGHWILRTSWVFSEYGQNFVKTMLRLAQERETLRVVEDQFGRPTYAGDLAHLVATLTEVLTNSNTLTPGIYHAVGGRVTSWHGFAETIFAKAFASGVIKRQPKVNGISSAEYPTAAVRPSKAVLSPSRAVDGLRGVVFDWDNGVSKTIRSIGAGSG